jgi:hypothetical protein
MDVSCILDFPKTPTLHIPDTGIEEAVIASGGSPANQETRRHVLSRYVTRFLIRHGLVILSSIRRGRPEL